MTSTIEALRRIAAPTYGTEIHDTDAERAVNFWRHLERLQKIARDALAAYDAAQVPPSDAEVEAWHNRAVQGDTFYGCHVLHPEEIDDALRLMRRARPDAGLLAAAKAVLAVDVLMRNAQNGMPAHVFNGVLEVLQEEAIPDLRAEVARVEGEP